MRLPRDLADALEERVRQECANEGRRVTVTEIIRGMIVEALKLNLSLADAGYREGWAAGWAEGRAVALGRKE